MSGVHSVLLLLSLKTRRCQTQYYYRGLFWPISWHVRPTHAAVYSFRKPHNEHIKGCIIEIKSSTNYCKEERCYKWNLFESFWYWKFSWQQQGFCNSFPGLGTERLPGTEIWRRKIEEALQSKESGHSHDNVGGLLGVVRLLGGRVRQAGEVVLIWWNLT